MKAPRDESRAFVETEITPSPVEDHRDAIAEADQKKNVYKEPSQPGKEATEMHRVQIGDSPVSTDGRERAFVPIPESQRLLTVDHREDVPRGMFALLDRDWSEAGQRLAFLVGKIRKVADNLHFRMSRNRQVFIHENATGAINRSV